MPVGEFIAEVLIRGVLEIIVGGLAYFTGMVVLSAVTLGSLRLAPLSTFEESNRRRPGKGADWNIWLQKPGRGRMLKAECVMLVGFLVWIAAGVTIYYTTR